MISAPNNSSSSRYIQKLYINGNEYKHNYITHKQLTDGTALEFKMSDYPNKQRGIEKKDAPYSFSETLKK